MTTHHGMGLDAAAGEHACRAPQHAYRSEYDHVIGLRLGELRENREILDPHLPKLHTMARARIARALAGGVGVLGAVACVVLALTNVREELTYTLVGSFAAMFVTYILARVVLGIAGAAGRRWRTASENVKVPLTGDLHKDLEALHESEPFRVLERKVAPLETWSSALPLAGLSLLTPLTLHWLFIQMIDHESPSSFAEWIRISCVVVGHAHIALLVMAIKFAKRLRSLSAHDIQNMSIHREWLKAWGITIGVSCVPFILLFAVPPILVAITGIAFIPIMYAVMRHRILSERQTLEAMHAASGHRAQAYPTPMTDVMGGMNWAALMREAPAPAPSPSPSPSFAESEHVRVGVVESAEVPIVADDEPAIRAPIEERLSSRVA